MQPELTEWDQPDTPPGLAEAVHVIGTFAGPAVEFDAELESAVGGAEKLDLVEPEAVDQIVNLRDCRLADADGADLIGFHQRDRRAVAEEAGERGRRDPARRPAA